MSYGAAQVYGEFVSQLHWSRAAPAGPAAASDDLPLPDLTRSHAGREPAIDALAVLLAIGLGALFLSPELHDNPVPLTATQIAVDVSAGGAKLQLLAPELPEGTLSLVDLGVASNHDLRVVWRAEPMVGVSFLTTSPLP